MRVVVDTNVVVSAALRNRDPEAVVLHIIGAPGIEWMATPPIVSEYRDVLRRPRFGLSPEMLAAWDRLINAAVMIVESVPTVSWTGDPGDAIFVACALGVNADFLITGDRGLLGSGRLGGTLVVTVSHFKRLVCDAKG